MALLLGDSSSKPRNGGGKAAVDVERGGGEVRPLLLGGLAEEQHDFAFEDGDRHRCRDAIGRLFGSAYNPKFADDAELATRAALFVVLVGVPFLVPRDRVPALDIWVKAGVYTHGVIIFFVYNLGKTLGETISNVNCGFRGSLLAVTNMWLMYRLFPGGVTDSSPDHVFYAGVINGVVFVTVMLLLNWKGSTHIFAINDTLGFLMNFLKPGEDNFHAPFSENFQAFGNIGVNSLFTIAVGGLGCLLVALFPYPRLAHLKAKATAKELVHQLPGLWMTLAEFCCEERPNGFHGDQIHRRLERLAHLASTMDAHLRNSWYECLGGRRWHRVRRILKAMSRVIDESYDRIYSTYCVTTTEAWSALHADLMRRVQPSLLSTVKETEALLIVCFQGAWDGELSEVEVTAIRKACASLREHEAVLTKAFTEARDELVQRRMEARRTAQCMEDLLPEHCFALHFSSFVRSVLGFAEDLCQQREDPHHFPAIVELPMVSSLWDRKVLCDPLHLKWAMRGACAIFAGFAVGLYGFSDLFNPYNATIPCTTAVLLSKHKGSAIVKNLSRVQGVVIGSIVGQILNGLFESCEVWSVAALSACLFLFALLSLFAFYNSKRYAYLGILLAGFGCRQMLATSCGVHSLDKAKGYDQMLSIVAAASLIVFFDVLFPPERASAAAHRELGAAVDLLREELGRHCDRAVTDVRIHGDELQEAIERAEKMGGEAALEPRYWRTQWREPIFSASVDSVERIRHNLTGMGYCMTEGSTTDGEQGAADRPKHGVLRAVQATASWDGLVEAVALGVTAVRPLVDFFAHETEGSFPGFQDPLAMQGHRRELRAAMRSLAAELAEHPAVGLPTAAVRTLEEDPICQVCAVFGAVASIMTELQVLQHTIRRGV